MGKENNYSPVENNSRSLNAKNIVPFGNFKYDMLHPDFTSKIKEAIMVNLDESALQVNEDIKSLERRIDNCLAYEGPLLSRIWELKLIACSQNPIDGNELSMVNRELGSALANFHNRNTPNYSLIAPFYKIFHFIVGGIVYGTLEHKKIWDHMFPNFYDAEGNNPGYLNPEHQFITEEILRYCEKPESTDCEIPLTILSASSDARIADIYYRNGKLFILKNTNDKVVSVDLCTGHEERIVGTDTRFNNPEGIAVDSHGNVFIADTGNNVIRKVDASGNITTVAGGGSEFGRVPGASRYLAKPTGLTVDVSDNLFITSTHDSSIIKLDTSGMTEEVAGSRITGVGSLHTPTDVVVDAGGDLYISDKTYNRIQKVTASTGVITTVVGNGVSGFSGDGGPAISARISPSNVAIDGDGNLLLSSSTNNCIRKVDSSGIISTIVRNGISDTGTTTTANLASPTALAVDENGMIYILDQIGKCIKKVDLHKDKISTIIAIEGFNVPSATKGGRRRKNKKSRALRKSKTLRKSRGLKKSRKLNR